MTWLKDQRGRLEALFTEFGTIAATVHFTVFLVTMFGFWWAIGQGIEVEGAGRELGRIGSAWAAAKLTSPVRIGITLVLTPLIAAGIRRFSGSGPAEPGQLESPRGEHGDGEVVLEPGGQQLHDRADHPAE